jgi:hypothetical protein
MPRRSAASLSVVPCFEELRPPEHLGPAEAAVFRDVIRAADRDHFRREDVELIALYCCHVVTARALMRKKRRTADQERALRSTTALIVNLSVKLRLGPKSRCPTDRRRASAGQENAYPPPWTLGQDQAEEANAPRPPIDWTPGAEQKDGAEDDRR